MQLKSLHLENFRNHHRVDLLFSGEHTEQSKEANSPQNYNIGDIKITNEGSANFFVGPNAEGKTNILEAIYLLALTKSFRSNAQDDLLNWQAEFGRIQGQFINPTTSETTTLEIFLGRPPQPKKVLKRNDLKTTSQDFIGQFNVVLFHPEDLNVLYLGPDLRRKYLDIVNIQVSKSYLHALTNFKKIIKQRNSLLKNIAAARFSSNPNAKPESLDVWDEQLATAAATIIKNRANTTSDFSNKISEKYSWIADHNNKVSIKYSNFLGDDLEIMTEEELKNEYLRLLKNKRHIDIDAQITTVGPHRDDLIFTLNGKPLAAHASRGEYRSLLLALKLLELEFYQHKNGQKPLLLLDDVFSELDPNRQKKLVMAINKHQTIITSTHLD